MKVKWKKFEPMWDFIIKAKRASSMLPVLERVLVAFGQHTSQSLEDQTLSLAIGYPDIFDLS